MERRMNTIVTVQALQHLLFCCTQLYDLLGSRRRAKGHGHTRTCGTCEGGFATNTERGGNLAEDD